MVFFKFFLNKRGLFFFVLLNLLTNPFTSTSNQKLIDEFFTSRLIVLFKNAPPPKEITDLSFL